jgi:hypothetical protein
MALKVVSMGREGDGHACRSVISFVVNAEQPSQQGSKDIWQETICPIDTSILTVGIVVQRLVMLLNQRFEQALPPHLLYQSRRSAFFLP